MTEIRNLKDIVDTGAAWITEDELAWMIGEIKRLQEALTIYREAFNKAIKWVDLDSLREGLYCQVERADEAVKGKGK